MLGGAGNGAFGRALKENFCLGRFFVLACASSSDSCLSCYC